MTIDSLKNGQEKIFKIEDAKPEDIERTMAIARDAWLEIYPNETFQINREDIEAIDWFNPDKLEKRRQKTIGKPDTHTWVVKDEKDNVVGFCKVSKEGPQEQKEIDAMFIVKEFTGKGLGKRLMEKALDWFGANGDIKLEVVSYNFNAINFYKRFGFKETTNPVGNKQPQLPSGKIIPRIVMVRS
jgi:GNAT superfamily N-acetyltransferase